MAVTTGSAGRGVILAFVYGLGIAIPFLVVSLAFQTGDARLPPRPPPRRPRPAGRRHR